MSESNNGSYRFNLTSGAEMRKFLFVLCGLSFLLGIVASLEITTVFQHIVAAVALLSSALLLVGAAVVHSLDKITAELKQKS
jgi:hypothetical protein